MFQDPIAILILAILIPLILFFVVWRYFKNRPADPAEPTNLGSYQPRKSLDNTGDSCYSTCNSTNQKSSQINNQLTTNLVNQNGVRKSVYFGDNVTLHWLWKETISKLESLARAVHDGRAVDEASSFSRWLNFSGLIKIFDAYPQPAPLTVDGGAVQRLVDQVIASCGQVYRGGKMPVNPSTSRIDELNEKVDRILSHIAKPIPPQDASTQRAGQAAIAFVSPPNTDAPPSSFSTSGRADCLPPPSLPRAAV